SHHLVEQAYTMLGLLPWSGFVHGFENHETITHLGAYMTQEWLSDVHEAQMLELLRDAIHWQKGTLEVEIEGPYFHSYLKSIIEASESQYMNSASFTKARGLGEALQSGRRTSVGFITNIRQNHWVATVIDFSKHCILYGDSLGGQPDTEFITVVQGWTQYHTGTQFSIGELAIPRQQDSFSCGILAFSALAHFYLPDEHPLMDARCVDDERLKIFLDIGKRHLSHVCHF
ncbi:hypothetical protein EV363DRAFT_1148160, partial [Boletus edulis]